VSLARGSTSITKEQERQAEVEAGLFLCVREGLTSKEKVIVSRALGSTLTTKE
jgi:hypothetical protein